MQIRLLGTAAGGGVPQWNCHCPVCREARAANGRVRARTQSSVAISANGRNWFLLNASPDIRTQIENFPPLQPSSKSLRNSPIEGVLLTNADLDHSLGLFLLREGEKLPVHATANVHRALTEGISLRQTLEAFCGIERIGPPTSLQPLRCRDASPSGLSYEAIQLPGKPPRFMKSRSPAGPGNVVGYRIRDEKTGGRLLFLPDVAEIEPALADTMRDCDALLFDGTFWSQDEMRERGVGTLSASDMGHIPISGPSGSLKILAQLPIRNKIYTHINNTNPVLFEDSPELAAVKTAGCWVGEDGMTIEI